MNRKLAVFLTALIGPLCFPLAGAGASAPVAPVAAATQEGKACVVNLSTGAYRCYSSLSEQVRSRTNGKEDASSLQSFMEPDSVRAYEAAARTSVNAIFYDARDFGGASLTMEAPSGCNNDRVTDWSWKALRSDWRNRFVSGRGYSRCQFKVYDLREYKGDRFGWDGFARGFGDMNRRTNSVRMR